MSPHKRVEMGIKSRINNKWPRPPPKKINNCTLIDEGKKTDQKCLPPPYLKNIATIKKKTPTTSQVYNLP